MSIKWRDAMSVGDQTIDSDHKHLIDLINTFEVALSGATIDHKQIATVLLGLVEYTGDHFNREEEIQRLIRYPYYDSHSRGHRDVLKKLQVIIADYTRTKAGPTRDKMVRDLAGFLKEWLVDHILQSDLRMKPFILQYQAEKAQARKHRREHMAHIG